MVSNAKATTKGAIMLLTNFVFITVIPSVVLAFLGPEGFRGHFWPFTHVLREICLAVTRELRKIWGSERLHGWLG
jgi:hypothetical protein